MKKAIFSPPVTEFGQKYDELKSSRKMGEYYGVDRKTITTYARQVGYDYSKHRFLVSDEIKKDIINRYNTDSSTDLAKEYNISRSEVTKIWFENNLKGKDIRKYKYNYNYFETIDKKDKAYFLGWIASDGNVFKRKNNENTAHIIKLSIDSIDEQILYTFCKYINRDYELQHTERTTPKSKEEKIHSTLCMVGNEWAEDLEKYNIIPKKTYSYEMVELNEEMMPHFFRGYFDGDGSIYSTNNNLSSPSSYTVSISGFIHNLEKMQKYLEKKDIIATIQQDKRKYGNGEAFGFLRFESVENKYKFLNYIYKDIDDLYLSRKKYFYDCFMTAIKNNNSNKANIYKKFIE